MKDTPAYAQPVSARQVVCPRCGLPTGLEYSECSCCGLPMDAETLARAEQAPTPPGFAIWRYFRPRSDPAGPIYVQRSESWVEVPPLGPRRTTIGLIPPSTMHGLLELTQDEAEAEILRRDAAFKSSAIGKAHREGSRAHRLVVALPGVLTFVAYLSATLWFGGFSAPNAVGTTGLLAASGLPLVIAGFSASLMWSSQAGEDAWWTGGLAGAVSQSGVVASLVWSWPPFFWSYCVLGMFAGFALGSLGGWCGQVLAGRLRSEHQKSRLLRVHGPEIGAGVCAIGVILALAGAAAYFS